jgi:hypothetical protein
MQQILFLPKHPNSLGKFSHETYIKTNSSENINQQFIGFIYNIVPTEKEVSFTTST